MPAWLQVLQGLLTPTIGILAVYIAWQQWKANERRLVLDRYERRLRVHQEVVGFLTHVLRDFKPEIPEVAKFRSATAEADFLFGSEITTYLDEVVGQALQLWRAHLEYRDFTQVPPPGYEHAKVVAEMHEREVWFSEQHAAAKEKFTKYLNVSFEGPMLPWKKWVVIGASGGAAFAIFASLIVGVVVWLVSRPSGWNTRALSVVSNKAEMTYEFRDGDLRQAGYSLDFALQNNTDRDITIPASATVMKRLTDGGVLVDYSKVARLYTAAFIPAKQRAELLIELDYGCTEEDTNGAVHDREPGTCYKDAWADADALVLFDNDHHLQLNLPKPVLREFPPARPK